MSLNLKNFANLRECFIVRCSDSSYFMQKYFRHIYSLTYINVLLFLIRKKIRFCMSTQFLYLVGTFLGAQCDLICYPLFKKNDCYYHCY